MNLIETPFDFWEYKLTPNEDLLIVNPEYTDLCDYFGTLEMLDYKFPVKFCRNMKDENHVNYHEWREWNLEVLKENDVIIEILKENGGSFKKKC